MELCLGCGEPIGRESAVMYGLGPPRWYHDRCAKLAPQECRDDQEEEREMAATPKKKVPFPNPNVQKTPNNVFQRASGTAGKAVDPISNQPMKKGSPVPAQNMSKAAQTARQFSQGIDDALLGPFQKKKGKK